MALAAAALGIAAYAGDWLDRVEVETVDLRFEVRGVQDPPEDVVVVAIDDATLEGLATRPTGPRLTGFPRGLHARVVDELRRLGVGTIAYDVRFTGEQEAALTGALTRARPTVLATTGGVSPLGSEAALRPTGARAGSTVLPSDDDGAIRRMAYSIRGLETFPVAAAELATRRQVNAEAFDDGQAWIDFHGPPGTVPTISFAQVLAGRAPPQAIRGKVAVVGATAPSLGDTFDTSAGGGRMSGAEIQANAISTLRRGIPLREAAALDITLIALLALVPALAAMWLGALRTLFIVVAAGLLLALAAQLAFQEGDRVLAFAYPLATLLLATIGALWVRRRAHRREPPPAFEAPAEAPTEILPPPTGAPVRRAEQPPRFP